MSKNYYFILMSQKDFLESQVIEELLRERANYYTTKEKTKDFWIINNPEFINTSLIKNKLLNSNFYKQKYNKIKGNLNTSNDEFYSALITSNFEFIKWIQLRIGYFEETSTINVSENSYVSDGLFGKMTEEIFNKIVSVEYSFDYVHPDILLDRYKKSIEIYYSLNS